MLTPDGERTGAYAYASAVLWPLPAAALDTRLPERPPDVQASRRGLFQVQVLLINRCNKRRWHKATVFYYMVAGKGLEPSTSGL